MQRLLPALIALVSLATSAAAQQAPAPADPNRWEPEIQKFEAEDKAKGLVKGGIVFIGSSSIARWTNLAESFPEHKVVNRGFGGSELEHAAQYAGRLVVPHAPRVVVLYAGENDLNRGVTPQTVFARLREVLRCCSRRAPEYARGRHRSQTVPGPLEDPRGDAQTNKLILTHCAAAKSCVYVDVWPSMIGKDGTPSPSSSSKTACT